MENRLTTAERITFRERKRHEIVREVKPREEAQAELKEARVEKDEARSQLTSAEKAAFGMAAVFSTVILAVLIMLTVIGFIFSPITHTLVFGLLAAATGLASYFVWRGGRCKDAGTYQNQ